jgi:hypothetical protein
MEPLTREYQRCQRRPFRDFDKGDAIDRRAASAVRSLPGHALNLGIGRSARPSRIIQADRGLGS